MEELKKDDEELLELAARGCKLPEHGWMGPAFMYVKDNQFTDWNPLSNDGDLYWMAREAGVSIDFEEKTAWKRLSNGTLIQFFWDEIPDHPDDVVNDAAHAIVRVVAEIGKSI